MTYVGFLYGFFTIIGGLIGYLKAGSQASLIAGGISGALLLLSSFAYMKGNPMGFYGLLVVSIALGIRFGMQFFATYKVMPAGIIVAFSIIMIIGLLMRPMQSMSS